MPAVKKSLSKSAAFTQDVPPLGGTSTTRILELQKKIQDETYLNNAIDRIAVVISRRLVENKGVTGNSADFLFQ
jgi:hypothetical protein